MEAEYGKVKIQSRPRTKEHDTDRRSAGDGVKYTFDGVSGDGTAIAYSFAVSFDGKDNAITGSMPTGADSISAKRIDSNTFDATLKQGGKVIGTSKVEVSHDGKVTTVTSKGTNAAGLATNDVSVYNKQ